VSEGAGQAAEGAAKRVGEGAGRVAEIVVEGAGETSKRWVSSAIAVQEVWMVQ
jgi:hypothetical protein